MKIVTMTEEDLDRVVSRAVERGVDLALARLSPEVDMEGVAGMFGVSVRTVRRMELRGELPTRIGRTWDRSQIQQFVAAKRQR